MSSILIRNTSIFNFHDLSYTEKAHIVIEGNKITSIVTGKDALRFPESSDGGKNQYERVIEGSGKIVIPGMTNAHSHTAMTLLRGSSEDVNSFDWFNKHIWIYEQNLKPEFVYTGSLIGAAEMLLAGVTFVCDHYFAMDRAFEAYRDSGIRADLAWALFGQGENWKEDFERAMDFTESYRGQEERLTISLGPHSPYICPETFLKEIADISERLDLKTHIHVSEEEWQVEKSLKELGVTPVKYLYDLGIIRESSILAHAYCSTDEDLDIIARSKALVAHAAKTYMKFGFLKPFLPRAIERGLKLSFASDGPASNNTFSILEVARDAALLCKLATGDAEKCRIDELVPLLSGCSSIIPRIGRVKEGYIADMVLIERRDPTMMPEISLPANILYSVSERAVDTVIVDGRIVVEGGKLLTVDIDSLKSEAENIKKIMMKSDKNGPMQQFGV